MHSKLPPERAPHRDPALPSLIRFLILTGGVVGFVYLGLLLLADGVKVTPREMSQIVEIPKAGK